MKKHFKEISPYLKTTKQATIASCNHNKPWTAIVFFAYDESLNIYFLSRVNRRHSLEILRNSDVSLAIAEQTYDLGNKVKGLQIEGQCTPLVGKEAKKAFSLFCKRFVRAKDLISLNLLIKTITLLLDGKHHKLWKVTPTMIKVFDETKYGAEGKEYH